VPPRGSTTRTETILGVRVSTKGAGEPTILTPTGPRLILGRADPWKTKDKFVKLSIIKILAAALSVALIVPAALALVPSAPASSPLSVTGSKWTVTSGPTTGSKPWPPEGGPLPTVSWTGKIEPALGSGQGGSISKVEFVCPGGNVEVPATSVMGAANGASFTIDIKQSALTGTHCSKQLKVTFDMTGGGPVQEYVTIFTPTAFSVPSLDYGAFGQLPPYELALPVKILDRFGAVNESYFGEVVVSAQAEGGGGVKLNGSWGEAIVTVTDGVGSILVDASRVQSGALVTFNLSAARTDPSRTSITRQ
jgi:hypothetical protein